jgi:hypothetical protein
MAGHRAKSALTAGGVSVGRCHETLDGLHEVATGNARRVGLSASVPADVHRLSQLPPVRFSPLCRRHQ